ncbi:MAG: helix-turn-helix transcriptional regulator [Tannerellaceae bacterium]|nr:helix-turn-helix transcriptional regulator [Tannerellaceae bacterium]
METPNEVLLDCPIRIILSRICEKWPVLILYTLSQNPVMRFRDLHRSIPDISQKMLTITLRTLEEDGLIKRQAYAEVPPRVEYSLTGRAISVLPHIDSLIQWAKNNMQDILNDRNRKTAKP